jgi:hypothetical protein
LELLRLSRIEFYAQRSSATERLGYHGHKSVGVIADRPQSIHKSLEDPLFLVVIAVTDTHSTGVTPDFGRQKQKTQSHRGQLRMFHLGGVNFLFSVEQ